MTAQPERRTSILTALRETPGQVLSGETLSSRLGVSRAQVWKHIGALRKRGYEIEGEPGGGYRLLNSPNRLYAEEIQHGRSYIDQADQGRLAYTAPGLAAGTGE